MSNRVYAVPGVDPYVTCAVCPVRNSCYRRTGKVALPVDYPLNPECGGFTLIEKAVALSGIPDEYRMANIDTFVVDQDNANCADLLLSIMHNPVEYVDNIALLNSAKGSGKTFTACAIANEFIFRKCSRGEFDYENPLALFVEYGDWSNEVRRAHQVGDSYLFESMYNQIDVMKEVPLLVLDDIGSDRITDIIRGLTFDIVNRRKVNGLPTIITSNFYDNDLTKEDRLGERITSRLFNSSTAIVLLGGRNRRNDKKF